MKLTTAQEEIIAQLKRDDFFKFNGIDTCFCCGNTNFKTLLDHDRYGFTLHYVRCVSCGYIFANPYYSDQCLSEFYSKYYALIYGRQTGSSTFFRNEYINARESIWPLVQKYHKTPGIVLDYGCAHGGSLMAFPKNWKRIGYDYDPAQMEYGAQLGLELRDIRNLDGCKEQCAVIMLNQVLEHTPNPVSVLKRLHSLLNDDGIIYLEVPSLDAIYKSNNPLSAFKNAHRHFFCIDSLGKIAGHAGLTLLYAEEKVSRISGKRDALRAILRKNRQNLVPESTSSLLLNVTSANQWADRIEQALVHPHSPCTITLYMLEFIARAFQIMRFIRRKTYTATL